MIVIRDAQLQAMGGVRAGEFERALLKKLYVPSNRWGARDEVDLEAEVREAIKAARALGCTTEASIGIFVELKVGMPKTFAEELARKSTQGMMASKQLSGDAKVQLLQQRVQARADFKVR